MTIEEKGQALVKVIKEKTEFDDLFFSPGVDCLTDNGKDFAEWLIDRTHNYLEDFLGEPEHVFRLLPSFTTHKTGIYMFPAEHAYPPEDACNPVNCLVIMQKDNQLVAITGIEIMQAIEKSSLLTRQQVAANA